jgi:hypothetical protein
MPTEQEQWQEVAMPTEQEQQWHSDVETWTWFLNYIESKKRQPPTAEEFSVRVEAELAKGLTEVEALHEVAREFPQHYDAYRNEAFTKGHLPGS